MKLIYDKEDLIKVEEGYIERFQLGAKIEVSLSSNYDISGFLNEISDNTISIQDAKAKSSMNIGLDMIRKIAVMYNDTDIA